ncbi:hypothetical protein E2320_022127, partial [Naja naja]
DSHFLQLGVGFEFSPGERRVYPSFFRINPKEFPQYVGLVHLLLYFQWNWVGLVAPESDNGECFISSLMPMLKEEICLAITEKLKLDFLISTNLKFLHIFKIWSKAEVIILFGDSNSIINVLAIMNVHKQWTKATFCKVWILTSHWKVSMMGSQDILKGINPFHGALHIRDHTRDVSGFSHFLLSLDLFNPQGDTIPIARCGRKRCQAGERRRVPEGTVCCYHCDAGPKALFQSDRMTGLPLLLLVLLLFWLLPPTSAKRMQSVCVLTRSLQILKDYYRPGDLIIGGNLPMAIIVLSFNRLRFHKEPFQHPLPIILVLALSSLKKREEFILPSSVLIPKNFLSMLV